MAQNTDARITHSTVESDGNIILDATNTSFIGAFAGGIAATLRTPQPNNPADSTNSVGAGIAINVISNDLGDAAGTLARIENSQVDAGATGTILVDAMTTSRIWAAAVGLAFNTGGPIASSSNAVGFSLGINVISTKTQAGLRGKSGSAGLTAGGAVSATANDTSQIRAISGAGAVVSEAFGNSNGVGISLAVNTITTNVDAIVANTAIASASLTVSSQSNGTIGALGLGAAGAGSFAVGGQLTINVTDQDVQSQITGSTVDVTGTGGDVSVTATNTSGIQSLSGGAALALQGQGTAIGAALAFNVLSDDTKAFIHNSTVDAADGSILVSGKSTGTIETISVGVSGAGQTSVAGSISTAVIEGEVLGYIQDSNVTADRNLRVLAEQDGTIKSYGGALAISASATGAGGGLSINVLTNETKAYIANSVVKALANNASSVEIKDWDTLGDETTETISGLAVVASSTETLELISASLGFGGGGAGVGVNLAPNFVADTTHAYIDDSDVNSDADRGGDVFIKSHQETDVLAGIGAAGLSGGGAGVGIAADGVFIFNDTQAYITDSDTSDGRATINSGGNVEVSTLTREKTFTTVVGLAVASAFAGAGSVDFLSLDNDNFAFISEVNVNALGSLHVLADNIVDITMGAGAAAVSGTAAAGGTFLVALNYNTTEARMAAAHTNAQVETRIEAKSDAHVDNNTVSLAGGVSAAFNGSFAFLISRADTRAIIEGGSRAAEVNRDATFDFPLQSVVVQATDNVTHMSLTGAATAAGIGGVGGALNLIDVQNTVDAHIGSQSRVSAIDDITVKANSMKDITGWSGGLSLAGIGLSGSFVVATVGSGLSSGAFNEVGSGTTNAANSALGAVLTSDGLAQGRTPKAVRNQLNGASANINATGTVDRTVEDVGAYIGAEAQITVGDDLTVEATETVTFEGRSGAVAIGTIAVGGSVTSLKLKTVTEAYVDQNAVVAVGDAISVKATANETVNNFSFAGAAAAGLGLGVQFSEAQVGSSQSAVINTGAQILLADEVNLVATHTRDVKANATGGALATVGAGLSDATIVLDGTVQAGTTSSVRFGQVDSTGVVGRIGSLNVSATSHVTNAKTNSNAVAAGVLAGNGAFSSATVNPNVRAALGTGTEVYATGAVQVAAQTDLDADANAYGLAVATLASAGGSVATARINPLLYSGVGASATVEASGIVVESLHNVDQAGVPTSGEAQADTTASGGAALIGLTGSSATADNAAQTLAEIGAATLMATTGNVTVRSRAHAQSDADATGLTLGFAGLGLQRANADITTNNSVNVLANATITSRQGDITLLADSSEHAEAKATAGSGGIIAVSDGTADVDVNQTTRVNIGNRALIDASETLSVDAKQSSFLRSDANANSGAGVAIPTADALIDVTGPTSPGLVQTNVAAATLRGDIVNLGAEVTRMDVLADANSNAVALGSDSDAAATNNVTTTAEVVLGTDSVVEGESAVRLVAEHLGQNIRTISHAAANFSGANTPGIDFSIYGNSDSIATTNVTTDSNVTTRGAAGMSAASKITTQVLNVRADAPVSPTINATATADQAYFLFIDVDGGRVDAPKTADVDRTIDFNSDVCIVNVSPVLEIDTDGTILTQEGVEFTDDGTNAAIADGTKITIDPIANTGSLDGEITFTIGSVNVDGATSQAATLSTIKGNPSLTYQTGFNRVTISVAAPLDIELQDIDVINRSVSPSAAITKSNVELDTLMVDADVSPGATKIEVTGTQDVTVAGVVDNAFGVTTLTAGEDILTATASDFVETETLVLNAASGEVGTALQPFQSKTSQDADASAITATQVTATVLDNIYLTHLAGDLAVAGILSDCGDATLVSAGGFLDGSGDDTLADIQANTILLDANGGSIGTTGPSGDGIEIDTLATTLALDAEATGDLHLVELTDALPVKRVRSTTGNIELTVTDADDLGQDLFLSSGETIQADAGSVQLTVGDDFALAVGASLSAGTTISILLDQDGLDLFRGSTANFFGTLTPTTGFSVVGGDDDECIWLASLGAQVPVSLAGGGGNDMVEVGTTTDTIDFLQDTFNVDGGGQSNDQLILRDGNSTLARSLMLTSSGVTDFDGALTGLGGTINFDRLGFLRLELGTRRDTLSVVSVPTSTEITVSLGAENDQVTVADGSHTLEGVLGVLNLEGDAGTDTLTVDDSGDADNEDGTLTTSQLTGLGMGANASIGYGGFEQLELKLGGSGNAAASQLAISGTSTPTEIDLGGGNDEVVLAGTLDNYAANLDLRGNLADADALALSFSLPVSFELDTTTLNSSAAAGTIHYSGLSAINANLSDGEDIVTIHGAGAGLALNTGGGADTVVINDLSVAGMVDLGDDDVADVLSIFDLSANLSVTGNTSGADVVTVDQTAANEAVIGRLDDSASGELIGVLGGTLTFDDVALFNLLLGTGNDHLVIDAGPNLAGTQLSIDGGGGEDRLRVLELSDVTAIAGGRQDDEVVVVINGFPIANQFVNLGVDVETLVVDNSTSTVATAWDLTDGILEADNADTPMGAFEVLSSDGADLIRVLGGTANDSLNVATETLTAVTGSVDGNQVILEYGEVVLEPGEATIYSQNQRVIQFDGPLQSSEYVANGLRLVGTTGLNIDNANGSVITAATPGDTFTLTAADDSGFVFYGLDLGSMGQEETVTFTATTINGTQLPDIVVTAQANGRLRTQTAPFANLNQVLRSISWNMPSGVRLDNLLAVTRVEDVMTFETLPLNPVTIHEEGGYRLTGSSLSGSQGAFGVTQTATYTLEAINGQPFSLESGRFAHRFNATPSPITFRGTTPRGTTFMESASYAGMSVFQQVDFSKLQDVTAVTFTIPFDDGLRIDQFTFSQGLAPSVPASVMPSSFTPAQDPDQLSPQTLVFDTSNLDNGDNSDDQPSLTLNGSKVSSLNGTSFQIDYLDASENVVQTPVPGENYLVRFTFEGDLVIPDGSTVTINGVHALSLVALNNAKIGESITFDVTGTDATSVSFGVGKVGGGSGGLAGTGSDGGLGTAGKNGGSGGDGGGGGAATGNEIFPGRDGRNGTGRSSNFANSGTSGTAGIAATNGFNGGTGGAAGEAGLGGNGGFNDTQ
ncbi:MAG: hypothetical protein AAGF97_02160, partial [Planctomycetota bacterium]